MDLTARLLATYDQIVIYGAKGWVGRSAADLLFSTKHALRKHQILLIGSKTESSKIVNLPTDIYSSEESLVHIGSNVLFLNSAYLRREKISGISTFTYEQANAQITRFGLDLIRSKRVKTFINLSSGAASFGTMENLDLVTDLYAKCKIKDESLIDSFCTKANTQLINCRIYSMSGKYINEFNNLALTSFINQAIREPQRVKVKSPSTLRTYIDSVDLVNVLFHLSLTGKNYRIDSGGSQITLGQLAEIVSDAIKGSKVEIPKDFEKSSDYCGNFLSFNKLAGISGIQLKDIKKQVNETLNAFTY